MRWNIISFESGLTIAKTSIPLLIKCSIKAVPIEPVGPVITALFICTSPLKDYSSFIIVASDLIFSNSSLSKKGAISSSDGDVILPSGSTFDDDFGAKF